eukprot:7262443-Prymnesium_polylepis.1
MLGLLWPDRSRLCNEIRAADIERLAHGSAGGRSQTQRQCTKVTTTSDARQQKPGGHLVGPTCVRRRASISPVDTWEDPVGRARTVGTV